MTQPRVTQKESLSEWWSGSECHCGHVSGCWSCCFNWGGRPTHRGKRQAYVWALGCKQCREVLSTSKHTGICDSGWVWVAASRSCLHFHAMKNCDLKLWAKINNQFLLGYFITIPEMKLGHIDNNFGIKIFLSYFKEISLRMYHEHMQLGLLK